MRRFALPFILIALPATVQAQFIAGPAPGGTPMPGISDRGTMTTAPPVAHDIDALRDRIRDGRKSGELSKREARGLKREAAMIGTLADRYAADGLSDSERRELDTRIEVQRAAAAMKRLQGRSKTP